MTELVNTTGAPAPEGTPASSEAPAAQTKYQKAIATLKSAGSAPAQSAPNAGTEPAASEKPALPASNEDLVKAREQAAYLKYQREAVEAKKAREAAEARAKAFEVFEGKDPKAILAALRERGVSLADLGRAGLDDPEPEPTPEDPMAAELRELKERWAAKEKQEAEAEAAEVFKQNVAYVGELLTKEAEKYPVLAGFKSAPAVVVKRFNAYVEKHGKPEAEDVGAVLHQIASEFNAAVYEDVDNILSSEAALKAYLTRPEIKDRVLSLLGAKHSASPASGEGNSGRGKGAPAGIPAKAAQDSGTRTARAQTYEQKRAEALRLLKQAKS